MRVPVPICLCLAILAAGTAVAQTFGRFAVEAELPPGFAMAPPPENDDGRSFIDGQGAEIRVWGRYILDTLSEDEAAMRTFYETLGGEVTYRAGGQDWYVLSGFLGQEVFYARVEDGETCVGEHARASVQMRYPVEERARYDPLIATLSASLGFGCAG
ncbi:hypothetical protein [Cognatishimia sp. F0-27]|uniref:hypothetical protein n=1 Tax=Cognatishimia sp. F0-27 TaxID=2816855 RepID=UPI001D0C7F6F|nr:hypothetical protein [Cognatishimia sp. F0-27]MCC1493640.1 hypothetical protein [Cognatishimia sp. F0-27]